MSSVRSGSFVYDAEICGLDDWRPKPDEFRVLSGEFVKFCQSEVPIERLVVSKELALSMFEDNEHKSSQIPDIASKNDGVDSYRTFRLSHSWNVAGDVTLYRAGDHVDISKGPMIANVRQVGRVTIPAVHILKSPEGDMSLYRFQGVALPTGIAINHVAYGILEERAAKLVQYNF
jgi:large subunit ribosomal protein L39